MLIDPNLMYDLAKEIQAEILDEALLAQKLSSKEGRKTTSPSFIKRLGWQPSRRLTKPSTLPIK